MRTPVRRAARRAFWPSLPIARLSWWSGTITSACGAVVGDDDLVDLGRRQRLGDEVGEVLAERDDVDLLAAQLVDDHADTAATGADAGADRVDVVVVAPHGDLGAVPWLAGAGLDLDDAVGDLGHLELEQPLDQAGVGAD